jgi:hypothetical protein
MAIPGRAFSVLHHGSDVSSYEAAYGGVVFTGDVGDGHIEKSYRKGYGRYDVWVKLRSHRFFACAASV